MKRCIYLGLALLCLVMAAVAMADSTGGTGMNAQEVGDIKLNGGSLFMEGDGAKGDVVGVGTVETETVQTKTLTSADGTVRLSSVLDGGGNTVSNVKNVYVNDLIPTLGSEASSKYYVDLENEKLKAYVDSQIQGAGGTLGMKTVAFTSSCSENGGCGSATACTYSCTTTSSDPSAAGAAWASRGMTCTSWYGENNNYCAAWAYPISHTIRGTCPAGYVLVNAGTGTAVSTTTALYSNGSPGGTFTIVCAKP